MKRPIKVGQFYEDCAYHIVKCEEVYPVLRTHNLVGSRIVPVYYFSLLFYWITGRSRDWDVAGESLVDGSRPRSCSWRHCGLVRVEPDNTGVFRYV